MSRDNAINRERRSGPRFRVDLKVDLVLYDGSELPGRIIELGLDGALLANVPQSSLPQPPFGARLAFRTRPRGRVLQLDARVLRLEGRGMAVRFAAPSAADLEALRDYLKRLARDEASLPAGAAPSLERARGILQQLTLKRLPGLVEKLQKTLQEALWQASESAASDADRSAVMGDLGQFGAAVREQRLDERLRRAMLDPMLSLGSRANPSEADAEAPLALVDTESFEVWLARSSLSNALEQRLREPLQQVRDLARGVLPPDGSLPVEPQGVAQALEQTLADSGLQGAGRVLCLSRSVSVLAAELQELYQGLIEDWGRAGLQPVPAPRPQTEAADQRAADVPPDAAAAAPTAAGDALSPAAPAVQSPSAAAPAHMPATGSSAGTAAAAVDGDRPALSAADLAGHLLRLSPADLVADESATSPGADLKQRMLHLLESSGLTPPLDARADERVDATDRMLNHMLGDPRVPAGLKALIQRLSMRFLALSLDDPAFYGKGSHPVLALLDRFEHLVMLAPDSAELKTLLDQALDTDVRNPAALEDLAERARKLEQRRSEAFQRNAERLVATFEGRERLYEAREQVRKRLNRGFAGRPMHPAVQQLLLQGWRALLELHFLRHGDDGPQWRQSWTTLLSVHGHCGGEFPDASAPLTDRQSVHAAIGQGLDYIGFDPFHSGQLLDALQAAMDRARTPGGVATDLVVFAEIPAEPSPAPPSPAVSAEQWRQALARVDELQVGGVLRQQGEDGETERRLLWRSGDGSELLFVDPRDLEPLSLKRRELAESLLQGGTEFLPPLRQGLTGRAAQGTLDELRGRLGSQDNRDPLTGLGNRNQLIAELNRLMTRDPLDFPGYALGYLGLDHFEALTGNYGYMAGERMLVAVAKLLEYHLEDALCTAYLGGSRFGFLIPADRKARAGDVGERLRAAINGLPFYWNGKPYPVVCSIGLAMVTLESEQAESLLAAADAACYAAQSSGGDRVLVFREGDELIARQKSTMDAWVRAADVLKSRRLRLRCQPILPAGPEATAPHHHEILLSVYDDSGAPLPLDEFISAAEAYNLMADMDRLVLEEAIRWAGANPGILKDLGGIAVNLSGQSMDDEDLVTVIGDYLQRFAVEPSLIAFEVTETAAIGNLDRAVAIIEGIRALGCSFALDDFGSGMSSYDYLKRLPVDYLKIDGSFVKDMLHNPRDRAIVKSINEIAHFMGKQTIAEYVENAECRDRLADMGVDFVQGFGVGRPRFLDELSPK